MSPSESREPSGSREFEERLTAYLDDRLSPDEARDFLAWLERRPDAWKEAESARRVWALLSAYRDEPVPEGFAERVLAKTVRADRARGDAVSAPTLRFLAGGRARTIAVAASLVVALGAGVLFDRVAFDGGAAPRTSDTVAVLNAMPAGLLGGIEGDKVALIASLSDDEFDVLLEADVGDIATAKSGG